MLKKIPLNVICPTLIALAKNGTDEMRTMEPHSVLLYNNKQTSTASLYLLRVNTKLGKLVT